MAEPQSQKGIIGFLDRLFTAVPLRMLAIIGAGVVQTLLVAAFVWIIWRGGWSRERQEQQLWYLGVGMLLSIASNLVVIGALTSSKIKGTGPAGVAFEIENSIPPPPAAPPPAPGVTVQTTVSAPGAPDGTH